MGYADRDYYREGGGGPPSRLAGSPVVKWLLFLNIGIFVVDLLLAARAERWGAYSVTALTEGFEVWRLLTFQFLHANFGHLLFNMIALYFFGPFVEQFWRSRGFLMFYLLCGAAGALFYSVLEVTDVFRPGELVGASAGIFGILALAALIAPNMQVRLLLPPVTLTMKQLALILLAIGALVVVTGGRNAGGEAGHLGGALAGFLLYKTPLLRQFLARLGVPKVPKVRPFQGGTRGGPPRGKQRRYERKLRPKSKVTEADASEVDRILDKINEHGLHSLTEEERILLTRVGRE